MEVLLHLRDVDPGIGACVIGGFFFGAFPVAARGI